MDHDFVIEQGKRLAIIRKKTKPYLSLQKIAVICLEEMDNSPDWTTIRTWEKGGVAKGCYSEYLTFICRNFNVNPKYLLVLEDYPMYLIEKMELNDILPFLNGNMDLRKKTYDYLLEHDPNLIETYLSEIFTKHGRLLDIIKTEMELVEMKKESNFT